LNGEGRTPHPSDVQQNPHFERREKGREAGNPGRRRRSGGCLFAFVSTGDIYKVILRDVQQKKVEMQVWPKTGSWFIIIIIVIITLGI
jgi:hypothetical protein